jgi:succinyl-diaminopimelate desuccinylase
VTAIDSDSLVEAVKQEVESQSDEIVQTLVDLVRIPTETPPGTNYEQIVERLAGPFRELGFDARRWDIPDDVFDARGRVHYPELVGTRANLLATLDVDGKRGAGFYCHLDTVPVGDTSEWTVEPFAGLVRDGWVWGRGASDSKAGGAAILSAFRVLRRLGIEPAVSPVVALTTDEEIGPYTGLMHMADEGVFAECDWFYSCDGMAGSVGVGTNGGFTWTITVTGKSVHSANAYLGVNPIEHSVPLLEELLKTKAEVIERRTALPVSPDMAALSGRDYIASALNVTIAHAGVKHNVVPPSFTIEGDRRFIPEEDEAECIEELQAAIDRARRRDPELVAELRVRPFYTSFACDPQDPWIQRVCRLASEVRGEPIAAAGIGGSSDIAHVARVTGLPVAAHGVARMAETRNHGADERSRISDLLAVTTIVALLAAGAG